MTAQTARLVGMKPEGRLSWVPLVALIFAVLSSLASGLSSYSLWRGQVNERGAAVQAAQVSTDESIAKMEKSFTDAIGRLEQSQANLESRLLGKVDAIQGSVANQQAQVAEIKARLDAAQEDKNRLWQKLEEEQLQRQVLERRFSSALNGNGNNG